MYKLFSIEAVKKVSDEMLEIFGGDDFEGTVLTAPQAPLSRLPGAVAGGGPRSASPSPASWSATTASWNTALDWIAGTDL